MYCVISFGFSGVKKNLKNSSCIHNHTLKIKGLKDYVVAAVKKSKQISTLMLSLFFVVWAKTDSTLNYDSIIVTAAV